MKNTSTFFLATHSRICTLIITKQW
uniref:Uncharacterized protein n=1 Tax=Moniliophthora roreri TaxID=221103 RepID=A0A0W0FYD6_MONRR